MQSAIIVPFAISAAIYTFTGPDASVVVASAQAQLSTYLANSRLLGRDITLSGLYAALTVEGVQKVVLASPTADVVCDPTEAANCTSISGSRRPFEVDRRQRIRDASERHDHSVGHARI